MNRKGQALIEFILIMPIFMFIILGLIDVANIITNKYNLEDDLTIITELYQNGESTEIDKYLKNKNINMTYKIDDKYLVMTVTKNIKINTPGLNNIIGKNKQIDATRTILNE